MTKYFSFDPLLPNGDRALWQMPDPTPGWAKSSAMQKTAAPKMPSEITQFVDALERIEGSLYFLSNALGNEEFWGPNRNGDTFPDAELNSPTNAWGYRTFTTVAKPFRGHKNQDPTAAYGDIPFAHYDRKVGRVYVIMRIDTKGPRFHEIEDIIRAYERGDPVATSMGARVPFDVCSICGNRAKTRALYCQHAREQLGMLYANGQKVFVRNIRPIFFDNSFVTSGADPAAFILSKVASTTPGRVAVSSALAAEHVYHPLHEDVLVAEAERGISKAASGDMVAQKMEDRKALRRNLRTLKDEAKALDPEYQGRLKHFASQLADLLLKLEPDIPRPLLAQMAKFSPDDLSLALRFLAIRMRPREFQYAILTRKGRNPLAKHLDTLGIDFTMIDPQAAESAAATKIAMQDFDVPPAEAIAECADSLIKWGGTELLETRSGHRPFILQRTFDLVKQARTQRDAASARPIPPPPDPMTVEQSLKETAPVLGAVGGLYLALQMLGSKARAKGIDADIAKHKKLLPLLIAGTAMAPYAGYQLGKTGMEKSALPALVNSAALRFGTGIPAAYLASGAMQAREDSGKELGTFGQMVKKHPGKIGLTYGLFGRVPAQAASKAWHKKRGMEKLGFAPPQTLPEAEDMLDFLITDGRHIEMPPEDVDDAIMSSLSVVHGVTTQ